MVLPGLGRWRLGFSGLMAMGSTLLARDPNRVNGLWDICVPVPTDPALLGSEVWFQALLWRPGRGLILTGADRGLVTGF